MLSYNLALIDKIFFQNQNSFYVTNFENEIKVLVAAGQTIKSGDVVIKMEAMKMENDITSEFSGTVKSVLVEQGAQVQSGQALVELA